MSVCLYLRMLTYGDTRIVTHLFCGVRSFCGDQNWVPKTTLPLNDLFWPETYSTV